MAKAARRTRPSVSCSFAKYDTTADDVRDFAAKSSTASYPTSCGRRSVAPVFDANQVPGVSDGFVVCNVAGDDWQSAVDGDGGDHHVGHSDGAPASLEVRNDSAGQSSRCFVECEHLRLGQRRLEQC